VAICYNVEKESELQIIIASTSAAQSRHFYKPARVLGLKKDMKLKILAPVVDGMGFLQGPRAIRWYISIAED
jgi:hypothetical protein